jgi:hypothetical protein
VVDHEGGVLQVERANAGILPLEGRAVVIDFRSGAEVVSLAGSLEIRRPTTPFLAAVRLTSADSPPGSAVGTTPRPVTSRPGVRAW